VTCMGEERKVSMVLVVKPKGKRQLGRWRPRWEDGIRMDLRKISILGRSKRFSFCVQRPGQLSAHPAFYPLVSGILSLGVEGMVHEVGHLPLSNAKVRNDFHYLIHLARCLISTRTFNILL
jgi:hypothetical protein